MRQLGELNKNGAQQFKDLGVDLVAVFRNKKEGLAGLKKIKSRTKVDFTLALDTPAKATAAYSNGRKEFDNYVVDQNGVIRGVLDGSLKSRAQAVKLLEIVKSAESDSTAAPNPVDDETAVRQTVVTYVNGIVQGDMDMMKESVHPSVNVVAIVGAATTQLNFEQLLKTAETSEATQKKADISSEVQVLSVTGSIASAKMASPQSAVVLHLIKQKGKWKILQILSQVTSK